MTTAGRDARFALLSDAGTTDAAAGTHDGGWTESRREWAACLPITDSRFAALRAVYPGAQFGLVLPYSSLNVALTTASRARWLATGREFDIQGVLDPDGRRREVHVALVQRFTQRVVTA